MNGREPRAPDAVIRRLRATLDARAGDLTVTPAFVERVRRLRRRRRAVRHVNQAMAVAAVILVAAVTTISALRPPDKLEFTTPPPVTPSPTASAPPATPSASPSSSEEAVPSEAPAQTADPADPEVAPPPAEEEASESSPTDDAPSDVAEPSRARVLRDGRPDPALACLEDDGTIIVTLDFPESEVAYVPSLDPAAVTIHSEGSTWVSDSAQATSTPDAWNHYTASFESHADELGFSELRLEVPPDLEDCATPQ